MCELLLFYNRNYLPWGPHNVTVKWWQCSLLCLWYVFFSRPFKQTSPLGLLSLQGIVTSPMVQAKYVLCNVTMYVYILLYFLFALSTHSNQGLCLCLCMINQSIKNEICGSNGLMTHDSRLMTRFKKNHHISSHHWLLTAPFSRNQCYQWPCMNIILRPLNGHHMPQHIGLHHFTST